MVIVFNLAELYNKVERSLSIIGKRSRDKDGNLLFTDITLGSHEKELANDYFRQAIINLATELVGVVTQSSDDTLTLTFNLPTNHHLSQETFIKEACFFFCVSYALYSWFTVTAPAIASKYQEDCNRQLSAVIRQAFHKKEPDEEAASYADITGTITNQ